jgi:hypothetical protein
MRFDAQQISRGAKSSAKSPCLGDAGPPARRACGRSHLELREQQRALVEPQLLLPLLARGGGEAGVARPRNPIRNRGGKVIRVGSDGRKSSATGAAGQLAHAATGSSAFADGRCRRVCWARRSLAFEHSPLAHNEKDSSPIQIWYHTNDISKATSFLAPFQTGFQKKVSQE